MLRKILAIAGRPGLYQMLSQGARMLIVETVDSQKKRLPIHSTERVVALSEISIYTDDDQEESLRAVFHNIQEAYGHQRVELSPKKASSAEIQEFFLKALPNYDTDRVHVSDMRKVLSWYNLLTDAGLTDFEPEAEQKPAEEQPAEADAPAAE